MALLLGAPNWAALDGRANAPAASIQYPTLFTGLTGTTYPVRPPWYVAGVDYAVGLPTGQALKNPAVDTLPTGCTWDAGNNRVLTTGAVTATFDGWDFTGKNITVVNTVTDIEFLRCKFAPSAGVGGAITANIPRAANITLRYCLNDGLEVAGGLGGTELGNFTAEYCWFKNIIEDAILLGDSGEQGGNHVIRYNLFESMMWEGEQHSDAVQIIGPIRSLTGQFNTFYQPAANGSGFPGLLNACWRIGDITPALIADGIDIGFNVAVGVGATGHNNSGDLNNPAINNFTQLATNLGVGRIWRPFVHDNYCTGTPLVVFAYANAANTSGVLQKIYANNTKLEDGTLF